MTSLPSQASATPDIYDHEIARLTEDPKLIADSWEYAAPLFRYLVNVVKLHQLDPQAWCGCLTMYRSGFHKPDTLPTRLRPIAQEIAHDDRIPRDSREIQPHHLPVFAEWQRRLDREFPDLR